MPYCFTLLQKSNQRIEKAERAIERETKEEKKIKKNYQDKKKKKKNPTEISVNLKKKHHKKKFETKVELLLKEYLGETDAKKGKKGRKEINFPFVTNVVNARTL